MRRVGELHLWIGNARDKRDVNQLHARGVEAVVDLAHEELPVGLPRELAYLRFPLSDDEGDEPDFLRHAIACVERLIRDEVPTLVACSAGTSRSPTVVAAALASIRGTRAIDEAVKLPSPLDLSPGLWKRIAGMGIG
jgi:hypothetical protein